MSGPATRQIENEFLKFVFQGRIEGSTKPADVALTQERELRIFSPMIGYDIVSQRLRPVGIEGTQELRMVLLMEDADGDFVRLLADDERKLRIRDDPVRDFPDPVILGTTPTVIYTVPANYHAAVEIEVMNDDSGTQTLDLWVDPTGTDTTPTMRKLHEYPQAPNAFPFRLGSYNIMSGGQVAGVASAADSIIVTPYPLLFRIQ